VSETLKPLSKDEDPPAHMSCTEKVPEEPSPAFENVNDLVAAEADVLMINT
jgi:hypothetical protein